MKNHVRKTLGQDAGQQGVQNVYLRAGLAHSASLAHNSAIMTIFVTLGRVMVEELKSEGTCLSLQLCWVKN